MGMRQSFGPLRGGASRPLWSEGGVAALPAKAAVERGLEAPVGPSVEVLCVPSRFSSLKRVAGRSMGEGVEVGDKGESKGG
jgi:hypothetical protein